MIGWLEKLEGKHKLVLAGVGLLFVVAVFYCGILAPQRERIAMLAAQCQTEQQQIKTIESYIIKNPDPTQHLQEMNIKVVQIDAKLPNQPEIGGVLKEIEQVAKVTGVRLLEIKPLAAVNKTGYREIPLEIQIRGTFINLLEFTKKLGEIQRFNSLANANIQAKQGMLEIKLLIDIYSYGVSAEPVSPPQQIKK